MIPLADLDSAAALVHGAMPPTPQYCWPLLSARAGANVRLRGEVSGYRGPHSSGQV